jgi:hypothetical protein
MVESVDLAWGREIHLGEDLNEEPMKGNDVDDQPTPIVKLLWSVVHQQSKSLPPISSAWTKVYMSRTSLLPVTAC